MLTHVRTLRTVAATVALAAAPLTAARDAAAQPAGEEEESASDRLERGAEKGTFGIGLYIGEPIGVTAKLYLEDDRAVQGAMGFAFAGDGFQIHGDYVLHPYILQDKEEFTMPVYVGPGVRFIQYRAGRDGDRYVAVGARAVAGFLFDFKEIPLDAFLEVAGVIEYGFADRAGFGLTLNAGAGARYYF
ncbi:MAG: hypothetical protein R3B48_24455 [Kofleriaceae bacterium]